MKKIEFLGTSYADLKSLKKDIIRRMGFELKNVQLGFIPSDFKPMPSVGAGVSEIRVKGEDGIARCFYVTKYGQRILILHVFEKKTQKTAKTDIELGKKRLAEFLREKKK